jgi:hypothetical protein
VSALVLDCGALIAVDRGDKAMMLRLESARRAGLELRSNAMVVAQAWRSARGRQVDLARVLQSVDVRAVLPADGRRAGELLGAAGLADAVDASVALLAGPGDRILTSDPADIRKLCTAAGTSAAVIPV